MLEATTDVPNAYAAHFADLRQKLVGSLGRDTVDLVLERAVLEVKQVYPGFSVTAIEGEYALLTWTSGEMADDNSSEEVRAAYSALYAAMLVILARILGREIAVRLASAVDAEQVLQGQLIGRA